MGLLWAVGLWKNYLRWPPLAVMSTILDSTYPVTSNYYHCFSTTHVCHCLRIKYSHFLHNFFPYAYLSQSCWKQHRTSQTPVFSLPLVSLLPSSLPLLFSLHKASLPPLSCRYDHISYITLLGFSPPRQHPSHGWSQALLSQNWHLGSLMLLEKVSPHHAPPEPQEVHSP